MTKKLRFEPEVDLDLLWYFEGGRWGNWKPSAASQRLAGKMKEEALSLAHPAVYYDVFPVHERNKRWVRLSNGVTLKGGLVGHLLGTSDEIGVAVCTIGGALDERVSQHFAEGHPARGFLLDRIGVVMLGALAERTRAFLDERARSRGWRVSTPISPGHADWELSEQEILFQLIPSLDTGVQLTANFVMQPHKSVTLVVGFGKDVITHEEGSQCEYCSLQKTCTYRRLPGESWIPVGIESQRQSTSAG